eukprot:ANDGO_01572.mRNA.1 Uncharacterized protein ML0055
MLRSALGGVLFVDEAYALIPRPGTFNQEIVDQIVQCLTDTEFVGKIVVIFAGYEADVEELMRSNDGLYRRFKETWIFEDWSPDTATTAALSVLRTSTRWSHLQFRDAERSLLAAFEALCRAPKWANGGDIETLLSKCDEKRSARGRRTATMSNVVSVEDVAAAAAELVAERNRSSIGRSACVALASPVPCATLLSFDDDDPQAGSRMNSRHRERDIIVAGKRHDDGGPSAIDRLLGIVDISDDGAADESWQRAGESEANKRGKKQQLKNKHTHASSAIMHCAALTDDSAASWNA